MKKNFKVKFVALILLAALIFSMTSVVAFAAAEAEEGDILGDITGGNENEGGENDNADIPDLPEDNIPDYSNPVAVSSADELEAALSEGASAIRIDADFELDRSFFVTADTVIIADAPRTLTRAADFGGDIFVVGENSDGTLTAEPVTLTLGKPDSTESSVIVIDGNSANMTADVLGTVVFVRGESKADFYHNITFKNHTKVGNERTLNTEYGLSYPPRVGGAVAIVSSHASARIFGGIYTNNRVNDITDSSTDEGTLSSQGGVIYNYGKLDVYGGTFSYNHAGRGGVFYNYRTMNLYSADIINNSSSTLGGAIYVPNSTAAFLYIGEENSVTDLPVRFISNTAESNGGAIYAQHVALIKNTEFLNNSSVSGDGGAIAAGSMELSIEDTVFEGNSAAAGYGGAVYLTGNNGDEDSLELIANASDFRNNTSSRGGAVYLSGAARAYFSKTNFLNNSSSGNGGAFYLTGATLDINKSEIIGNSAASYGGAIALYSSSVSVMNDVTASENESTLGGFTYINASKMDLFNSNINLNSAPTNGGAVYAYTDASFNAYNTSFADNTTASNGGALMLYTGGGNCILHTCTFKENNADGFGGGLYISNKSQVQMYNITATANTAGKGGFMYETTSGTVVHLVGLSVSGNTATDGGPIIWGNTLNAKLYIDKIKYVDSEYTGDWNDEYWANAIVNKLTVYDEVGEIPSYVDYTGQTIVPAEPVSITNVSTAAQLERALQVGYTLIRITADFELDRTFYIMSNVTIFADEAHTLSRAPGFAGDIFVVGENADGEKSETELTFSLGKKDGTDASLTIDGNKAAMTVDVVGTVVFVCNGARADFGKNLIVTNHKKVGNARTLGSDKLSYPPRVGGAVAIIENGAELNLFGGVYSNNETNSITDANTDEGSLSSHGGAFYNHGYMNIYGGLITGNFAGRGGAIYNYRTLRIYSVVISGNSASTFGGAVYTPNSTAAFLYVGEESELAENAEIVFSENSAVDGGGALYIRNFASIKNATFENNISTASYGGAIYAATTRMTIENSQFVKNTAPNSYGGAIYLTGSNEREETREMVVTGSLFDENGSKGRAGAIYMSGAARAYFKDTDFLNNTSAVGGVFYLNGASLEMNCGDIIGNKATSGNGGVMSLNSSSTALLNGLAVINNTSSGSGGMAYVHTSTLDIYNSTVDSNSANNGGAVYVNTDGVINAYSTVFRNNSSKVNGGALTIYNGGASCLLHSCTFETNVGTELGGGMYISNKSQVKMYNITASGNSALKGGFMYETTSGTVVRLVGLTVSGNTATEGGAIIWGNTTNAKLYIDKSKYEDKDVSGSYDSAYWSAAIYNKLTTYEASEEIPKYLDYGNEAYDHMSDAVDVATAAELESAILSGIKHIRIVADFLIDRTFYITGDTTIFTTIGHTLTRAPEFGGDIFVVGESADGKSSLLMGHNAKLTLGNPLSEQENLLVIDGNKDNMQTEVKGSVLFICYSANVSLYKNVTVMNCHKVDNERTLNEKYRLGIENRIGATLAVVASGTLNIYGGNYKNNSVNEEVINGTDETGRNSTVGGLIFNSSNLNIYGGTFENNKAARGAVIYNYRVVRILGGHFLNNVATVSGGVYYTPNSAQVHLYVGSADEDAEKVIFENNSAKSSGGVIYASTLSANVIYGNASFIGNMATNGSGGAICMYGQLTVRDSVFENNIASNRGGAIYASNSSIDDVTRFIEVTRCTFDGNMATLGGAISLYASSADYPEGGIAFVKKSTFKNNRAAVDIANTSAAYGGAVYLDRKAYLKAQDCTFTKNEASTEGGAVYIAGESTVDILSSSLTKNSSGKYGGAITVRSSYLNIKDSEINQNSAKSNGGAIYVSYQSSRDINTKLTVTGSQFISNVSEEKGGAIYATRRDIADNFKILTVTDTDFEGNIAVKGGGALYTLAGVSGYFENASFLENSVTDSSAQGGAVYAYGSNLEFNVASFVGNTALSSGGAISTDNSAEIIMHEITASANVGANGGFAYLLNTQAFLYDSTVTENSSTKNAGAIYVSTGAILNAYNTVFEGNSCEQSGGALMIYTDGAANSVIQNCTFIENSTPASGGAIYISKSSLVDIYNITGTGNSAAKGGFLYITTSGTVVNLIGATVSGNTATEGGAIIWGNSVNAKLIINKSRYTDSDYSGVLDDAYWSSAIYNLLTVQETTSSSIPSYKDYTAPVVKEKEPTVKPAGSVDEIFDLANSTGSEFINDKYDKFPVLDSSSNFMSDGTTYFENINGTTVTVDSFVYDTNATDGNCTVGEGLLIYQAMLYKKAHPEEDVSIHLSAYRLSIEAAVNINRNNRYFGYMRNLGGREYDANGFVRVSYLLVSAARMGINVTVIGQIDGYPRTAGNPSLHKYFNDYLATECDPAYAEGTVGDYMNFAECFWTLTGKGGTDMMHTKLCAVSHYLDMNGVEHRNAVWTSSSNLDGITSSGANGNYKLQTATIVSDHEYIYRVSANYLNLIAEYCAQEQIYEFQDIMSRVGAQQIELILAGKMNEIAEDELLVYLGTENDSVFELYFTPFAGSTAVWDEQNNPYCKYIREMYNSEDSIIFIWNAAEYNSEFPLGDQMEDIIVGSFYKNKNPENKFFGTMENFDKTKLDGLTVGVDVGYISVNKLPFGSVHNKDILLSYVKDGQRYYVSLLNSCNMHSGSMCYQSNFMLVIKETDCDEDSVFFTMADLSTTGIVEHTYGEETFYIPEDDSHGYYYLPCLYCDKKIITGTIHRPGEWVVDREGTVSVTEIAHKPCTDCGCTLEIRETEVEAEELSKNLTEEKGISFAPSTMIDTEINTVPATLEAFVQLDAVNSERGGVIIGNYSDNGNNIISIEVHTYGRIRLYVRNNGVVNDCFFNAAIANTEMTHVAVTLDGNTATLYLNGTEADSRTFLRSFPNLLDGTLVVGGDRRYKNSQYFKGRIYSAAIFDDVRTEAEIRRDSIAVVHDAEGLLYARSYASLESGTVFTDKEGITFTEKNIISLDNLKKTPLTIEAIIKLPKKFSGRGGVIFGNYANSKAAQLNLEIYSGGAPRLYVHNGTAAYTYVFNADVRSDGALHIAVVIDGNIATLYVAGEAVESVIMDCSLPAIMSNFKIGGDNRADNSQYFKGTVYAVGLYGRAKSAEEILSDTVMMDDDSEDLLYLNYYHIEAEKEEAPVYGASFGQNTNEKADTLSDIPRTFEATIRVPKEERNRVGVILGNYDGTTADQINLEIFPKGKVRLYFKSGNTKAQYVFTTDIRSSEPTHIAVTVDGRLASLYVNGEFKESATMTMDIPNATEGFVIGGDRREGNEYFFRGEIFSIYMFSDIRTPEEIRDDYLSAPTDADKLIYSKNFVVKTEEDEVSNLRPMGQTFAENIIQNADGVTKTPTTFEAVFSVPVGMEGRIGTLVGNYDEGDGPLVNIEIYSRGQLRLFYAKDGERVNCLFKADLRTGVPTHIALTIDGLFATLYVNGMQIQTKELTVSLPEITSGYMIGGDHRYYNSQYFKGILYSVALFDDVRTEEEIRRDISFVADDTDGLLYSAVYMEGICDPYAAGFVHVESEWIIDAPATEAQNGLKHKECLVCNKTLVIQEISSERKETVHDYVEAEGLTFSNESDALVMDALSGAPMTIEAIIHLAPSYSQRAGVVVGSYDGTSKNGLNVEIFTNGRVRLYYKVGGVGYSYVFTPDIRSEWLTHIAVVIDGLNASLYVNGDFKETILLDTYAPEITDGFRIGSDRRLSDGQYFKGTVYGVAMFDDVRTAQEIKLDSVMIPKTEAGLMYLNYLKK